MEKKAFEKNEYKLDHIYLNDGKKMVVKELYKQIKSIIESEFDKPEELTLLDVGTASGEIPYYLSTELNLKKKCFAFDYSPELVANAKKRFGEDRINFFVDNAQTFELKERFDVIVMCGVITIFDDYKPIIDRALKHLTSNGLFILVSMFGDYDVEVMSRFRMPGSDKWQSGYNIFPLKNVTSYIENKGYITKVRKHIMPFDMAPQADQSRSWTVKIEGNKDRMLTNGLQVLYNIYYVSMRKRK